MTSQPLYLLATASLPEGLAEEASKAGMTLDVVPFIEIEYLDTATPVPEVAPEVAVFTSVHAVMAVKRWLSGPPPNLRIYCVSGATYKAVVEAFGEKAVVGKARSAGELAELIRDREKEITLFCGDRRREELPSIGVTEKIVYRTVLTPRKLERPYAGIAFFSPSAVESFFSVNAMEALVPLFAIGKTTEAAIRSRCSNPVFACSEPDKTVLIRKMIDYFLFKP
jgi:uroporphyrinogen-III synthase